MAVARRVGLESSKTRVALLDAAEHLMREEGYAAVTSRRVASLAGLKPQLVHYYFRTMEDLFLAIMQRRSEESLERQTRILASNQPLWALWESSIDPAGTTIMMEFVALSNHRKAIRAEIAGYGEQFRNRQIEILSRALATHKVGPNAYSADVLAVLMTGISRILIMEEAMGISTGHANTRVLVEGYLQQLEGPRKA